MLIERNHHWGSRWGSDRNRALWSAFTVRTPSGNIFFAGDTGWGDGAWVREAARAGPYRLAIIPIGAYLPRDVMQNSHVGPREALAMFRILDPRMALAVHWGRSSFPSKAWTSLPANSPNSSVAPAFAPVASS